MLTGLPQVRKWSGKKVILQGQGKVREFYFESGKLTFLKKSQGKLKETFGLHCDIDIFP